MDGTRIAKTLRIYEQIGRVCLSIISFCMLNTLFSWSFGVLLYELYTMGDTPYSTIRYTDMIEYLENGHRLPQPEPLCSAEMYFFLPT
jgi:hypothetical protein